MQAAQSAQQQPTPKWDEFRAGVTAVLRSWSALRAAVEGGWGGIESHDKAEFLRDTIYGYYYSNNQQPNNNPVVQPEDLEDILAIYLQEEFSVNLEDDSERQVASVIWQLYETCLRQGNTSLAEQVVASALSVTVLAPAFPVQVQSTGDDDDDDDDDCDDAMMMEDDNNNNNNAASKPASNLVPLQQQQQPPSHVPIQLPSAAEYAAGSLFGGGGETKKTAAPIPTGPVRQLGEAPPVEMTPQIQVDDDGFAPVIKRKGAR